MSKEDVFKEINEVLDYIYESGKKYKNVLDKKVIDGEDGIGVDVLKKELESIESEIGRKLYEEKIKDLEDNRGKELMKKYKFLFSDSVLIFGGVKNRVKKKK